MVLDLSHHNIVNDWQQVADAAIIGVIHKASEGSTYKDPKYDGRRSGCREKGIEWGAYHFATASPVDEQVENYLVAADPDKDTMLVLDWEPYGDNTMSVSAAKEWITQVEQRLDRPGEVVIYSGNLAKEELDASDTFFGARRLWLAQYGSTPKVEPPWSKFFLWQYSDGQTGPEPKGCPGVQDPVDTNSFNGSAEQLRAEWASGEVEPAPTPTPRPVVTVTVQAPAGVKVVVHTEEV